MPNNILLPLLLFFSCNAFAQNDLPCDKNATKETINLYRNLKKLVNKGFMFGHQDDLAYGVGWKYEKDRSDVKDAAGDYPALYGWDFSNIESAASANSDGVPFDKMRQFIKEGYERGGVITMSWHAHSPLGAPKGAWDTTHGTVASILPGAQNHELFTTWLDRIADFLLSLKGDNGETIPVLFRPFHELTGSWFWWGKNECSEIEFKALWRFVVHYLRDVKKVHSLLYIYNTAGDFNTKEEFLKRYPGDDVVDMVSFDAYQYKDPAKDNSFVTSTDLKLSILDSVAAEKNKIAAFGETGYEAIPYSTWWTDVLMKIIGRHKISYVLVWRNHGYMEWSKKMHYYAPYKGQASEQDFKKFYNMPQTLFEKDVKAEKLYE